MKLQRDLRTIRSMISYPIWILSKKMAQIIIFIKSIE